MRGLNHQLKQLCRHNREGSFGTQVRRERELTLMANQLHEIGYRGMNSHSLKPKAARLEPFLSERRSTEKCWIEPADWLVRAH